MADPTDGDDIHGALRPYRQSAIKRLEASGTIETDSGSFDIAGCSISFAADPGCETFNDDFIAVWKPANAGGVSWAAAIADGVTGSLMARSASELACYFGLAALVKANVAQSAVSKNPIAFVTRLFHQIGRRVQSTPEHFRPSDCPSSIWKLAIREGKILQTTLTLVWSTPDGLCVMAVGDGGILYSYADSPAVHNSHMFGSGKLKCFGPFSAPVQPEAYLLENWSNIACFTDGLAEAVNGKDCFTAMLCDRQRTVTSVIDHLNADCQEFVDDNLSAFRAVKV